MKSQDIIRKACKDEIPIALKLLRIAATRLKDQEVKQWHYWIDPPRERLQWLQDGFDNLEFYFLVRDSRIIAMYRLMNEDLKYWGKQEKPAYYVHSLVVHPDFKGERLGVAILDHIQKLAINNNIALLRLDCDASNKALCKYYLHYGFQEVGKVTMPLSINALFEKHISIIDNA